MNRTTRIVAMAAGMLAAIFLFALATAVLAAASPASAPAGAIRYVDPAGSDTANDCLDADLPCQTVQHAVDQAADGDEVYLAVGTFTENVVISKEVALLGGFYSETWERSPYAHSVLDGANGQLVAGDWDGASVQKVAVISDTGQFKMWYDGTDVFGETAIGYAIAPTVDGWTKDPGNPVLVGDPGGWDEFGEHAPYVMKDGGVYKMWYEGNDGGARQLGYATSPDGVSWTKYGSNPVLEAGPEGYDQDTAGHGSVLKEGGDYSLWYHAIGDQGVIIAFATSPDGTDWTKQGPTLLPDDGGWDTALWGPSVVKVGGQYWMYYSGAGPSGAAIGVVTSTNGIDWTRFLTGPVVSEPEPIGDPHVLYDGTVFHMWYQNFLLGRVHYAESADGINWMTYPNDPVLEPGALVADPGMPVVRVQADGVQLDGLEIRNALALWAGGVSVDLPPEADFTMFNCSVNSNQAAGSGGAGLGGTGHILIENSRFLDNEFVTALLPGEPGAAGAIRTYEMSNLTIVNSLIAGNLGDAAVHANGNLSMMNVTIVDNAGDVIFNPQPDPGTLNIQNSILYFNEYWFLPWAGCPAGSTCSVTYSDVQGGFAGMGNVDADPLFGAGGRLTSPSPAIDAGSNTGAPPIDLEFNLRPVDGDLDGTAVTDMGASEFVLWHGFLPMMVRE